MVHELAQRNVPRCELRVLFDCQRRAATSCIRARDVQHGGVRWQRAVADVDAREMLDYSVSASDRLHGPAGSDALRKAQGH
jgi:hypothetical protein